MARNSALLGAVGTQFGTSSALYLLLSRMNAVGGGGGSSSVDCCPITFKPGAPPIGRTFDTWAAVQAEIAAANALDLPGTLIVDSSIAPAVATGTTDIEGWSLRPANHDTISLDALQVASGAELQNLTTVEGPLRITLLRDVGDVSGLTWPAFAPGEDPLVILTEGASIEAAGTDVGADTPVGSNMVLALALGAQLILSGNAVFRAANSLVANLTVFAVAAGSAANETVVAAGPLSTYSFQGDSDTLPPSAGTFAPAQYTTLYVSKAVRVENNSAVQPIFTNVTSIQAAVDASKNRGMEPLWQASLRLQQLQPTPAQNPAAVVAGNFTYGTAFEFQAAGEVVQMASITGVRFTWMNLTALPVTVRCRIYDEATLVSYGSVDVVVPALTLVPTMFFGTFAVPVSIGATFGRGLIASVYQTDGAAYVVSNKDDRNPCGVIGGPDSHRTAIVTNNVTYYGTFSSVGDTCPTVAAAEFVGADPIFEYFTVGAGP